jgi:histidyl-tRNA synthetase
LNNRKILSGLAEAWDFKDRFGQFAIAIDKWDKIGENGVVQELGSRGFTETQIHQVQHLFRLTGTIHEKLNMLDTWFAKSETGQKGVAELRKVLSYLDTVKPKKAIIELDLKLARGLDYYTSTIFEVVLNEVQIGSIASGGRYDELTAGFGLPNMPGVGISFGAERIYDVLKQLDKLPAFHKSIVKVLILNSGGEKEKTGFEMLAILREHDIASEIYPSDDKIAKQFAYAGKKGIINVVTIESEGVNSGFTLKNIETGHKQTMNWKLLVELLTNKE